MRTRNKRRLYLFIKEIVKISRRVKLQVQDLTPNVGRGRIGLVVGFSLIAGLCLSFAVSSLSYTLVGTSEEQTIETIVHKSPLVWRTDGQGDYLLSELVPGGTYELIEEVETANQIETIIVTWKSKGEATLQVSANNGQDYTPVVYGVPLDLAHSGNRIKWRVTLGPDSELSEIRVAYTDAEGAGGTFGVPELSGFGYRKSLNISNPSGEELFNYQVKVEVDEEGIRTQADFGDIRFTATDGETLLAHYLDGITGESPNKTAVFLIKIPQIPPEGLPIYLYYGNPDAESLSSGEDVFDFFDDFSEEPDSAKWELAAGLGGKFSVSNSFLKLDAAKVISKDYQMEDGIIEYRAKAEAGYEVRAITAEEKGKPGLIQLVYSSTYPGAEHAIAIGSIVKANTAKPVLPGVFYDYRVIKKGENITFERYGIEDRKEAEVSYTDEGGLKQGYIGLEVGGRGDGDSVAYYDWLRVRKFAEPEPSISTSGDEEEVNLAEFSNVALANNGNITALDSAEHSAASPKGTQYSILDTQYTTAPLLTACNISAVTPAIKVSSDAIRNTHESEAQRSLPGEDAIRIDISADGGLSWKEDCVSGRTYRAPFDFTVGRELLLRANFPNTQYPILDTQYEIEQIKLEYSIAPIVTSTNVYCSGATGEGGVYISGDAIIVEWDNSATGDNNPDILSVSCNFVPFGGESVTRMYDNAGDNTYIVEYKLPEGIDTTANIFVTAANSCGLTTRDGHMLMVDTMTEDRGQRIEDRGQKTEDKRQRAEKKNLKKRYTIKFGKDEAEVGDFRTEDFRSHAKLKRWGKECYLSIELPDSKIKQEKQSVELAASKIEWTSPGLNTRFYKKPSKEITKEVTREVVKRHRFFRWIKKRVKEKAVRKFIKNENGGLEFEIILKEKPSSNLITLPIAAEGLKFYYQGPLTQEEIDMGVVRPDEVVDSYAVYHTRKKDGKYTTGKAFHIYRPKIIDNNGDWIWGELKITEDRRPSYAKASEGRQRTEDRGEKTEGRRELTITIDRDWLNSAAYPVIVDPEFGYMSIGSSSIPIENALRGSIFTAYEMIPDSITAYLENIDSDALHTAKYAIYSANDLSLIAETVEVIVPASSQGWYEGRYISQPNLLAQEYALAARGSDEHILIYFDQGTPDQGVSQTINYTEAWPEAAEFAYDDNIYSIYDAADETPPVTATITVPMSLGYSIMPDLFQGEVADNSGGGGLAENSAVFYLRKVIDTTSYYWDGTDWDAVSAVWLATTHIAQSGSTAVLWSDNVTLPTWVIGETYFVRLKAVDIAGNELLSGDGETSFYYSGPPGLTAAQEVKVDAIQAKTDTIDWDDITSIKTETDKITSIKTETDKIASIKSETAEILVDTGTTLPSAVSAIKSETAEILTDTGTTLPSAVTSAKEEMVAGIESRIINEQSYVRQGETLTIKYKTDTGLSPTIDVYSPNDVKEIDGAAMTESISGSGIYEYDVKFSWGRGEHTIVCNEESKGTLDGINIQVISTDLEQISADATTTMRKLSGIDTDQIEMFTARVAEINTVIANTIASMDELAGMSTAVKKLAEQTIVAIYSELRIGTEKLKKINEDQGIKIEKMYDLSTEQSTDVDYIKNKTLEIRALSELTQEILSRVGNQPIVKNWMESVPEK